MQDGWHISVLARALLNEKFILRRVRGLEPEAIFDRLETQPAGRGLGVLLAVSTNPDPDKRESHMFGVDCNEELVFEGNEKLPLARDRKNLLYCCWDDTKNVKYLYEIEIDLNL